MNVCRLNFKLWAINWNLHCPLKSVTIRNLIRYLFFLSKSFICNLIREWFHTVSNFNIWIINNNKSLQFSRCQLLQSLVYKIILIDTEKLQCFFFSLSLSSLFNAIKSACLFIFTYSLNVAVGNFFQWKILCENYFCYI